MAQTALRRSAKSATNRGVFLTTVAAATALILLVLGYASFAITVSYKRYLHQQLQNFADNIARSALHTFTASPYDNSTPRCPGYACWYEFKNVAFETARYYALDLPGTDKVLDVTPALIVTNNITTATEPSGTLTVGALSLTVSRGRWLNDNFHSLEDPWQEEHPGVPVTVVSNAVKVEASLTSIPWFLDILGQGGGTSSLTVFSVAAMADIAPQPVAPFAIPVCNLIREWGEVRSGRELCSIDISFTSRKQFCPTENATDAGDDATCQVVPDFMWYPSQFDEQVAMCNQSWGTRKKIIGQNFAFDSGSGELLWQTNMVEVSPKANFGVVGLPNFSPSESISEVDVVGIINQSASASPHQIAAIGDPFAILANGLTSVAAEEAVWLQITDQIAPGSLPAHHPRYMDVPWAGENSPNGGISVPMPVTQVAINNPADCSAPPLGQTGLQSCSPLNLGCCECSQQYLQPPPRGACNSRRFGYARRFGPVDGGGSCDPLSVTPGASTVDFYNDRDKIGFYNIDKDNPASAAVDKTTPVWKTKFPIVGDMSGCASPCRFSVIPPINFVANVNSAQQFPDTMPQLEGVPPNSSMWPIPPSCTSSTKHNWEVVGYVEGYLFDTDIGRPPEIVLDGACVGDPRLANPWAFDGGATPQNCNAVRARTTCDNFFFASSSPTNTSNPPRVRLKK